MDEVSKRLASLSPGEKRALLAQLLRKKVNESRERFPLSQGQRALWFLYQLAPESTAYNLLYAARVHSGLDVEVLQHALQTLVHRYPILTATYVMHDKEPTQQFQSKASLPVEVIDADGWSLEQLRSQLLKEGNRAFNLERGPLLRVQLYRRSAQDIILALVVHHIIVDLWALDLLVDELCVLYAAEKAGIQGVQGMQAPLPRVEAQFTDYVRWQSNMLAGPEGERHWNYWQSKLSGELPVLNLPTDRPRPLVQTYHGASHSFALDDELSRKLRTLASAEKVTLYTLILTVYELLLFRYTDQEDLLIGTTTLGRNRADFERVIGYLANPVPLRTDFSGNPTFKDLLRQVRQNVGEALEHQDYPFPLLVERLQPRRDPSYSPLIQTLFIWDRPRVYDAQDNTRFGHDETARRIAREIPVFESFIAGQQGAPFDLTLTIFEVGGSLSADFRYNVDLFDAATLARMEQHFQVLLAAIVANPEQGILDLPMLTATERQTMLIDWNATQSAFPEHACIHRLFEQQVERTSDAVALVFEDTQLTYRELNHRANRVAHTLQNLGVGPDVMVGVCMERSLEMVTALLAILKAGGAYVPLEPSYPRERLHYMINDANLPVVLTQARWRELLPDNDIRVLALDSDWSGAISENAENPGSTVQPDNLVYMIYTSGSTGKPKGVMNIHRAVCNRLYWMQQVYQLTVADHVLQKTPFSFDVSAWEFFWPLITGARLVVARPGGHQNPAYLAALIAGQQISTLHFVPSMLQAFLDEPELEERCARLKRVICSGEALSYELQERFFSSFATVELHNLYGPTEAAIDVTYWRCQRNSTDRTVPIGYPIANTQLYILNRAMQPVPVGVAGELHIGGVGLARGYHNRPELTAERFIPDPFSARPGGRLFKTGDLARYRADGAIEFLGRIDHQVKIRGVRIELGEIEAVLSQHPAVKEAVVKAREDTPGNKRLVAYLVLTQAQHLTVEELRSFLREILPQDLLPSAFVFLYTMPLLSNGKVNRHALPAPDTSRPELEATYVAPRTPVEEQLVQAWQSVLGIDKVGIHDNFFDLGGASIQSLQAISQINDLGYQLTPEMLFEFQTIAELAAQINTGQQAQQPKQAPASQNSAGSKDRESSKSQEQVAKAPANKTAVYQEAQPNQDHTLIESIGVYLPPKVVSTQEVLDNCSKPIRFPFAQLTGIKNRRMAGEAEFAIDLARQAVARCLENSRYNPEDIDLVICSSISRCDGANHHFTFEPSTAVRLQNHFGFKNALVFDISNACTGMFTGMYIVDAFLQAGLIRRGLVVSGEYITHLTQTAQKEIEDYMDSRMACLTVGDAGAAVILERTSNAVVGFHEFEMYTLGRYYDLCIAKVSDMEHGGAIMYTDAVRVSAVNIQQAVAHAATVVARSGWPHDSFQHIVMHQTSKMTIYDAAREINSHFGKELCNQTNVINNIAERGNTATTTHVVALMDNILNGSIKARSNVIFGITGSGVNIGTAIYTFDDLPDRLRRYANGAQPEKVPAGQKKPVVLLPATKRVRVESVGTVPLQAPAEEMKHETLEMARVAAENCFSASTYTRDDVDLLIYAGVYRDEFICEPAIAAMVAGTVGINADEESQRDKRMFSFDIFNGGTGFLQACYTGVSMIRGQKASKVMVVTTEVENNKNSPSAERRGIQEAGAAILMDESPGGHSGFGNFVFKTFPEYNDAFNSYTVYQNGRMQLHFEQDPQLEDYYLRCIHETVRELLEIEQLDLSQIKVVLPPQISSSFIARLSYITQLDKERFVDVQAEHDLFTSSLPYALKQVYAQNLAQPGDIGLIINVGAGIQVGCAMYYF